MKILHTSDWHIGRQFHNVSLIEDQRHVLNQIIQIAEQEKVDVVLIAGDIYDRSVPPSQAVALLDEVLDQLHQRHITVILISGNHDGAERLRFGASQMGQVGVHILADLEQLTQPVILHDQFGDVAFYGIPYADPVTVKQAFATEVSSHDEAMACLVNKIEKSLSTKRNILLSHCFIDGGQASESERPLSIGGAECVSYQHFLPFDYVALGHLHGRQYKGDEKIRYSGSILKYSFSEEKQIKSVVLVELGEQGVEHLQQIPLTPLRDMRSITGSLQSLLQQGLTDPNKDDYLLVQLTDSHAILDIMGKLREVYPNVLHLERPGLISHQPSGHAGKEQLKKGEQQMFSDFFEQVTGEAMDDAQTEYLNKVLQQIHRGES